MSVHGLDMPPTNPVKSRPKSRGSKRALLRSLAIGKKLQMFTLLKSLFVSDPSQKLAKSRDKKYKEAVHFQRSGDLRTYARLMSEIDAIDAEIAAIQGGDEAQTS